VVDKVQQRKQDVAPEAIEQDMQDAIRVMESVSSSPRDSGRARCKCGRWRPVVSSEMGAGAY
jgi:hypothetical protein